VVVVVDDVVLDTVFFSSLPRSAIVKKSCAQNDPK
jgi:hypothetical protein